MAQIPDVCEFETNGNQINLMTSCNGDVITIGAGRGNSPLHLTYEQAATLSYLINQPDIVLVLEIKVKPS